MELKIFRDSLWAAGNSCTLKSEIAIEAELLISDYLPQVFKIVKTFVKMVVLQKQLQQGKLTVDGYLRCVVYYQGEDGKGLCQTEQKVPFNKTLDIPPFEFSTWNAVLGGEVEYLNCRAVNGRRIEIRGAYGLCAIVNTQIQKEIVSSLVDCGIEQKQVALKGVKNLANIDKLITTENEIVFDETPNSILDISGTAQCKDIKLVLGKAVIKGEVEASVVYTVKDGTLKSQSLQMQVNQIVDIDGITDDCLCSCVLDPIGFTVTSGGETNEETQISANVMLHVRALRGYEINAVCDAFSTKYESDTIIQNILPEKFVRGLDEVQDVFVVGQLSDENAKLLASFVQLGMPEVLEFDEQIMLCAKGVVTAFCENSLGEIESIDKNFEMRFPLKIQSLVENIHAENWLFAQVVSCAVNAGQFEAKVQVNIQGFVLQSDKTPVLADIAIGEEWEIEDPEISLRIYYAQSGESVFNIAREYHVSPSDMMLANGLEKEVLNVTQRLLVPGIG